jgi:hypothetical protein
MPVQAIYHIEGKKTVPGKVSVDIKVICESGVTRGEHN